MTDIERMAKEAGLTDPDLAPWMIEYGNAENEIRKFAALIAEECAKEAESHETWQDNPALWIATAIRSKFPMPKEPV